MKAEFARMSSLPGDNIGDLNAWIHVGNSQPDAILSLKGVPLASRLVLKVLSRIEYGIIGMVLPDGRRFAFRGTKPGPEGVIVLNDHKALRRALSGGSLGFAEAYLDGQWQTDRLTSVLECMVVNAKPFGEFFNIAAIRRVYDRVMHMLRPNTRSGARKNIHAHYDLGNAFYARWLDDTMTYSAARFERSTDDLAKAQTAKYKALADMMELKPGERVLEIGCGWGGFAEYAARERGAHVTAVTISREQLEFARARMARQGLSDKVEIRFQDYRDIEGQFEKIASIEMFEAVGERYWPAYFDKISQVLKPGGIAALQVITIEDASFDEYRRTVDFIQKYVFPGGMLPSMTALKKEVQNSSLKWETHFGFALDYARTLSEWQTRFLAAWDDIREMGFDERFKRLWTYYLSYCEAGFRAGSIDVIQMKISKPA
jgi:cyclopropane-fatty-acyl-phospholipid synthase